MMWNQRIGIIPILCVEPRVISYISFEFGSKFAVIFENDTLAVPERPLMQFTQFPYKPTLSNKADAVSIVFRQR